MKQSIANVWVLGLVISFILIFSGFIIVTINYNKVFKEKNTILTIIEKKNGFTTDISKKTAESAIVNGANVTIEASTLQTINVYLSGMGYRNMGTCPDDGGAWYGIKDISPETRAIENARSNEKYFYCVSKYNSTGDIFYYKVRLFFFLDLPIVGNLIPMQVDGTTAEIHKASDGSFELESR